MITYSTHIDDRTYLVLSRFMFILAVGVAVYKYENVLFTTQSNKQLLSNLVRTVCFLNNFPQAYS